MSETIRIEDGVKEFKSRDEFEVNRKDYVKSFTGGNSLFKRKITQSLYWTSLDKDLANQFLRDERWVCGLKFWDAIKVIDHDAENVNSAGMGFFRNNKK